MQFFILFICSLFSAALMANDQKIALSDGSKMETDLFLTPAGKYTLDDIIANGKMTRTQKYKNFTSTRSSNAKTGDLVCPITATKANPECVWIIGGKTYQFCCPACIDEFLTLAKTTPQEIHEPEYYTIAEK